MENKSKDIQAVIEKVKERFGPGVFVPQPGDEPDLQGFKHSKNKNIHISVLSISSSPCRYSVQVTLEGEEHRKFIGTSGSTNLYLDMDIPVDNEVNLDELIEIFERYK